MTSIDPMIAADYQLAPPLTTRALHACQMGRLRDTLARVRTHSPYYRTLYADIRPAMFTSSEDLTTLPLLDATDIITHGREMVCVPPSDVERIVTLTTSGSTDSPKRLYFSQDDLDRTVSFFTHGMATMTATGERTMVCMPCQTEHGIGDLLAKGLTRYHNRPYRYGLIHDIRHAADTLRTIRPHCIVGLPVQLLQLAHAAPDCPPHTVLLSADQISDALCNRLEALWGCRILTHYGLTESGYGAAVQCPARQGQHIRYNDLFIEIIDPLTGQPVPTGGVGEIVLTTLTRTAMPLIRYRTGDQSRLITTPCLCGSTLPRLDKVISRRYAQPLPGCEEVTMATLDDLLFAIPHVLDYRADFTPHATRPALYLTIRATQKVSLTTLTAQIKSHLPPQLRLTITQSDHIRQGGPKRLIRICPT